MQLPENLVRHPRYRWKPRFTGEDCDVLKICVNCNRPFIFYFEEDEYWRRKLGPHVECIRCVECRKEQRAEVQLNEEYQRLLAMENKGWEEYHDLACVALALFAEGKIQNLEKIRAFINKIPESQQHRIRVRRLHQRIKRIEEADARNEG